MNLTKISVITINYNNLEGLQKTMQSVFCQKFLDFEYIIIDGGSNDSSKEYIEQHANKLSYWISEKDTGVYNAQNKGIKASSADYLLFLNSGDYFKEPGTLKYLAHHLGESDIIYGDILYKDDAKEIIVTSPDNLNFDYLSKNTIPHPCTLIKRSLFDRIGLYREEIKIGADWAFFLDAIVKNNATYIHVNEVIAIYALGGISSNPASHKLVDSERLYYLESAYSFILREHKKLMALEYKMNVLKKSNLLKFLRKIFPYHLGNIFKS